MLRFTVVLSTLLCFQISVSAQSDSTYHHMFRAYDKNDLFKLVGEASDKGYTNGTGIEYYYTKDHPSRFFLDKWMPKAGKNAINTFGISLTQDMFTPSVIDTPEPDVADWPYSGALYATHSLHSYNPVKKYNITSEVVLGVMGKAAFTKQMQTFIHSMISSAKPEGWDKEYPTDLLLNINLGYEHALLSYHWLEILGGAEGMVGTQLDGATVYGYVRIGKFVPYFNDYISTYAKPFHHKNHFQIYAFGKPALDWIAYDAVLEGGVFRGKSTYYENNDAVVTNHKITRAIEYGAAIAFGPLSASFSQTTLPRMVDGIKHQRVGNITVQLAF